MRLGGFGGFVVLKRTSTVLRRPAVVAGSSDGGGFAASRSYDRITASTHRMTLVFGDPDGDLVQRIALALALAEED